ncbi:unnamed protein product [Adineta steineri]|uniref:Carotenoid oxygenase n=1 Tax=Adineta steineri TaxID=433720 RepID=A0A819UI09_9BILA|nr:unnamed protein product [Adineta steineri]
MTALSVDTEEQVWNNYNLFTSTKESTNEEIIKFQGKIPEWLKGNLYRNGPGAHEINGDPKTTFNHAFDGFAFIQKYNIDGSSQTVGFRGSFVKSRTYTESIKNGSLKTRQFGTDPCQSILGRFQNLFFGRDSTTHTDDTGVTVQVVQNELLALTETTTGNILDPDTLEHLGALVTLPYGRPKDSPIISMATAHVMYDNKRKMTVGYGNRMTNKGNFLDIVFIPNDISDEVPKVNDDDMDELISRSRCLLYLTDNISERGKNYNRRIKATTKSFRFPCDHVCYMHSASISENYLILTEIPYHFTKFYGLWYSVTGGSVTQMFKWNGETMPTYFRIISLDTGEQIAYIPGPAFFQFHHINSYECENNKKKIIVDICAFDDPRIIDEFTLNNLRENIFPSGAGYVRRFEVDLDANTCIEPNANAREPKGIHANSHAHSLIPIQFELPRINPNFTGKKYQYVYAVRAPPGRIFDGIIKLDVQTKEVIAVWEEPCTSPSEPIFVPRSNDEDSKEDDGVILSVVLEQKAKRSFLIVLDGITFKELARAYLPVHIPLSFHGNFY